MKPEPQGTNAVPRPLNKPLWWGLFLLATFLMSLWFQTFKAFTLIPTLWNGLIWLGVMFVLILNVMLLSYDSYAQEAAKGNVQKPIRLFNWLLRQRFLIRKDFQQKETVE